MAKRTNRAAAAFLAMVAAGPGHAAPKPLGEKVTGAGVETCQKATTAFLNDTFYQMPRTNSELSQPVKPFNRDDVARRLAGVMVVEMQVLMDATAGDGLKAAANCRTSPARSAADLRSASQGINTLADEQVALHQYERGVASLADLKRIAKTNGITLANQ